MIKIAICDDDIVFTTRLEELIMDFGRAYSFDVCIYFDGDTLLEAVKQGNCFDIILMDIEMKRMNGISAAKIIRKIDEDVQLIYISSHEEYVLQLFDVNPAGFFEKASLSRTVSGMSEKSVKHDGKKSNVFLL